ncbi:MAG: SPL family radical SAM protein [Syntrophobacteraceae bacterium]
MKLRAPKKIIAESAVAQSALLETLRKNLPDASLQIVDRIGDSSGPCPDVVEVVDFRGKFLKSCPGTRCYNCCGYKILHLGTQCSIDCSYCILQAYLNQPNLRLFGNLDEMFSELSGFLAQNSVGLHRIGTGEFTDSLLLDPFTGITRLIVPFFAKTPNAVLELKTKTDFIQNLKGLDHGGHTIVAWSLNPEEIQMREEPLSATISQRLEAARACAAQGYFLAFHFDPIIDYARWQSGYAQVIERLFEAVEPSRIVWISLGALRFMPDLKPIIKVRHPSSRIIYGEFIRGLDSKLRYFRDIRAEFYAFLADKIRRLDPSLCVYLCMESDDIWRDSLGFCPDERGGLAHMLDRAVEETMGIVPLTDLGFRADKPATSP